jgi:hypothetical protein
MPGRIPFVQGGYYHIHNRGAGRQPIFPEEMLNRCSNFPFTALYRYGIRYAFIAGVRPFLDPGADAALLTPQNLARLLGV